MKVLALLTDGYGGFGGISQYNRDFCRALANKYEVHILPRSVDTHTGKLPQNVFQYKPFAHKILYFIRALFFVVFRKNDYLYIFCGHLYMAPLAAILAKMFNYRLWLQVHGIEAWKKPSALIRWSVEQSDLITSVSRYTRKELLRWANIDPNRVKVIPNTLREQFCYQKKLTTVISNDIFSGKQILLTVSRLNAAERYKGHDLVINSLPNLLSKFPKLHYVIIGDGDDKERLQTLVTNLDLNKSVHFLGKLDDQSVVALFHQASLYVMPSTGEGFGIVFVESMACGLPALGGNRDGSVDALQDGYLGNITNFSDLEVRIEQLLRTPVDREKLANQTKQLFGFDKFSQLVLGVAA
ncbi:MAG: glycosyltransferase family 4 protein [Gammaproteobacteria bacterium]|nr:glycosyltransferase family 4 protein [Gammaproteobacteria bacterium]MDH5728500.1 glycosyltransferase family 4 protein [Gammaproteobacteria bacterium]